MTALGGAGVASMLTWALAARNPTGIPDLGAYRFTSLSLDPATEREPAWSPDGRALAYTANIDGIPQVMVRQVGATTALQLTRGTAPARSPFWAPDGTRVYFLRGPMPGLWSVSAVGGEPELVILNATSAALHPRDGRIVFARGGRLMVLGPGAKDAQPLGQAPFDGTAAVPSAGADPLLVHKFSPDGTKLAVLLNDKLWLLSYPGGAAREIRLRDLEGVLFDWMPDSRHVVTVRVLDGQGVGLSLIDTEAGTTRTILTSPVMLMDPTVSPDGKHLAFVTGDDRWKLIEVTLADGRVRELGSGVRFSMFPSLSPDGTRRSRMVPEHQTARSAR